MNLFFPQWQGAGKTRELLKGALEIKEKYMKDHEFLEIAVSDEENAVIENNILGFTMILQQLKQANSLIAAEEPQHIFTVGGGCDVEIVPVSYLNYKLNGDLTVLWIDAHDALDYEEFPYVMVPAPGGLKPEKLLELLNRLKSEFRIAGLSLLEYTSSEEPEIRILNDIIRIGTAL